VSFLTNALKTMHRPAVGAKLLVPLITQSRDIVNGL
jgi:hypothetical protein